MRRTDGPGTPGRRAARVALLAAALLLPACGGGAAGDGDRGVDQGGDQGGDQGMAAAPSGPAPDGSTSTAPGAPSSADPSTSTPAAPPATAAPPSSPGPGTTTAPESPGRAVARGGTAPRTPPSATGGRAEQGARAEQPDAPDRSDPASDPSVVPGRYTYDVSGTVRTAGAVPRTGSGTARLQVEPVVAGRQTSVLTADAGRTETEVVLRDDGAYLSRLLLTTPGFSEEFAPSTPVLLLPAPFVTGQSWTWSARSTDGTTTVTARNRVTGDRRQVVGGRSVATAVVESVLEVRGDVTYDGTTTVDHEPETGLPVLERSTGRGTARGAAFSTDTSSRLRSLDPE